MKFSMLFLSCLISTTCFAQSYVTGFGCADPTGAERDIGDYQVDENLGNIPSDQKFSLRIILGKERAGGEQAISGEMKYFSNQEEAVVAAKSDCRSRGGRVRYAGGQFED